MFFDMASDVFISIWIFWVLCYGTLDLTLDLQQAPSDQSSAGEGERCLLIGR